MTSTAGTVSTRKHTRRVVVRNVGWVEYLQAAAAFDGQRSVRLTYDRGVMEIMVIGYEHDFGDRSLFMFVMLLAKGFGKAFWPGGQTTLRRKDLLKGAEADEIFWIDHASAMVGAKNLDLTLHPPPDLAVEVDVSRRSARRLRVLAGLGVPEVWQSRPDALLFLGLVGNGYVEIDRSRSFPLVTPADLFPFVLRARTEPNQLVFYDEVLEWARERAQSNPAAGGEPAAG